jgi:hypothetical protein
MRMGMRRFTRLTNAFSKKVENHAAMVAIHFLYYNFARIHKTLRVTPAMAAGLSDSRLEPTGNRASGQLTGLSGSGTFWIRTTTDYPSIE